MRPEDVTEDSTFLAWWVCPQCEIDYRMRVCDRVAAADDGVLETCPACNLENWTKYAEPGTAPIIEFPTKGGWEEE